MIVIKHIDFYQTANDLNTIRCYEHRENRWNELAFDACKNNVNIKTELIKGRIFIRPDGTELIIGCSKQAADVIGIQYEAWDNLQQEHLKAARARDDAYAHIRELSEASFLTRLKWLFIGIQRIVKTT